MSRWPITGSSHDRPPTSTVQTRREESITRPLFSFVHFTQRLLRSRSATAQPWCSSYMLQNIKTLHTECRVTMLLFLAAHRKVALCQLRTHNCFLKPYVSRHLRCEVLTALLSGYTGWPTHGQFPRASADHNCFLQQIKFFWSQASKTNSDILVLILKLFKINIPIFSFEH